MENLFQILSHHCVVLIKSWLYYKRRDHVITSGEHCCKFWYNSVLSNHYRKFKRTVVNFARQNREIKGKLTVQQYNERPPQLINAATLPSKMKHSPSHYTATP